MVSIDSIKFNQEKFDYSKLDLHRSRSKSNCNVLLQFFVVNPILTDLAILCKLGL